VVVARQGVLELGALVVVQSLAGVEALLIFVVAVVAEPAAGVVLKILGLRGVVAGLAVVVALLMLVVEEVVVVQSPVVGVLDESPRSAAATQSTVRLDHLKHAVVVVEAETCVAPV
jgi:ABC-type uncharacterized transport system permease subunit